jgi:hypothetical protein
MLSKLLDWIDESASGLIRLAYLFAGIVAVAAYFGNGTVPNSITDISNAVLPWALAFALETHTYLTARCVRSAWQGMQATVKDSAEYERAVGAMKINLCILVGLLSFSMLNQLQYLSQTWTPPHTGLALPTWLAYIVRAVVIPLAFLAAAFLVPVGESLTAQIKAESHRFAGATFKVAWKQWKARLKEMRKQKQDVTHALIGLVDDPDERRIMQTIHAAMYSANTVSDTELTMPSQQNQSSATRSSDTTIGLSNNAHSTVLSRPMPVIRLVNPNRDCSVQGRIERVTGKDRLQRGQQRHALLAQ